MESFSKSLGEYKNEEKICEPSQELLKLFLLRWRNSKLGPVDSKDGSTPDEFDSMIVSQEHKSLPIKPPMSNVSGKLTHSLFAESNSFASDVTFQSESSNQPSIRIERIMEPSMISGSHTPIPEDSKTSTILYPYEYPNNVMNNKSEIFNFSHGQTTLERSSNTDSSLERRAASSRRTRNFSLMKDVHDPKSGDLRYSYDSSSIRRSTGKLPSSTRERNNTSNLLKKRRVEKLRKCRKPYEFLTTGSPLLKVPSRKPSHWRHFEVDVDLEYLISYGNKNSIGQTRIALVDIEDVLLGQVTPGFHKCPRSQLIHQSFSIKYKRKRYLDLICLTHHDCQMWYHSGIFYKIFAKGINGDWWGIFKSLNSMRKIWMPSIQRGMGKPRENILNT